MKSHLDVSIGDIVSFEQKTAKVLGLSYRDGRQAAVATWADVARGKIQFYLAVVGVGYVRASSLSIKLPSQLYDCYDCGLFIEPDEEPDGLCISCRSALPCGVCDQPDCKECERSVGLEVLK